MYDDDDDINADDTRDDADDVKDDDVKDDDDDRHDICQIFHISRFSFEVWN